MAKKPPAVQTVGQTEIAEYRKLLLQMGDGVVAKHLCHLVKSRYKIIYIRSQEEMRVLQCLQWLSLAEGYDLYQWDCSRGLLETHTMQPVKSDSNEVNENPSALLGHIIEHAKNDNKILGDNPDKAGKGHIYTLLDFHHFLEAPDLQRQFKEFFGIASVCHIVIISPVFQCPPTLNKEFTLIDFPLPSRSEIRDALEKIKHEVPANYPKAVKYAIDHEEELLDAAAGLTVTEAENAYALSLVKTKNFDIKTIIEEKKQIISKTGILEFREPKFTFDDIGGLEALKVWLDRRKTAFSQESKEFGLEIPKGVLLAGIPGTGKSLICDALAARWQMPLLRLDIGAIFSSHVGESEANVRLVLQTSSAIAPAILWIDEIEKGLGGVQSSNQTDGGVTNRVFGTLLTWMQEKDNPVFVICTANNVTSLPPEFMRAGRFDEIFFLDLPNADQRQDVLGRLLLKKKRNPEEFDLFKIAQSSENYSPAELEKGINNALFCAFSENKRQLTTEDIVSEIIKFQPLFNSRREEIEAMREWALGVDGVGGRAVLANSSENKKFVPTNKARAMNLSAEDL